MNENELSKIVIGEAIEVHRALGSGLLEKVYIECLAFRLRQRGLIVDREFPIPVIYEEVKLDYGYRADLIVEGRLLVEAKSVDAINEIFISQVLTYLKFAKLRLGLIINFNVVMLKSGIKRVIKNL